jgi:hypothetical protein
MARFDRRLMRARAVNRAAAANFADAILPIISDIRSTGIASLNGIARELRRHNIPNRRAGERWTVTAVRRVLQHA